MHDSRDYCQCDAAGFSGRPAGQSVVSENATRQGQVWRFLNALFGSKPWDLFLLLWRLPEKRSRWFRDVCEAAAYVEKFRGTDVYVGVSFSPADYGSCNRCKAKDTAGMPALWMDFDYQDPVHKKKNLPPTMQDALGLIPPEIPPSMVIHSGHGLQAWWIFAAPWTFANPEDRQLAAALADDSKRLFKQRAAARGWDVDSVADLARVMRVPGTTNTKIREDVRPVDILEINDLRYDPQGIRAYLDRELTPSTLVSVPQRQAKRGSAQSVAGEDIVLDPGAKLPIEKFRLLCDIEPRFRRSWEHRRRDLRDQSPSAYDQSLATFAARVHWSDAEIVALLIAHRRKHRADLKLRQDYYRRTIEKARAAAAAYWAELETEVQDQDSQAQQDF
jgi:hypothetical protein